MYDIIAGLYSELFPPDNSRCGFIIEECGIKPGQAASILDAGCATGDLAFELSNNGIRVSGIDIDPAMISIAKQRADAVKDQACPPDFFEAGLNDIGKLFQLNSFDGIVCFGNTLPHLLSEAQVEDFFRQASALLKPGGKFIFQIINFDLIEKKDSFDFPDIDTGAGIFRRKYRRRPDKRLDFIIELTDTKTGSTLSDSVPLLPIGRQALTGMLTASGLKDICIYTGYERMPADGTEFASIYTITKN